MVSSSVMMDGIDGWYVYSTGRMSPMNTISRAVATWYEYETDDISTVAAEKTNVSQKQLITEQNLLSTKNTSAKMRYHFSLSGGSDTVWAYGWWCMHICRWGSAHDSMARTHQIEPAINSICIYNPETFLSLPPDKFQWQGRWFVSI